MTRQQFRAARAVLGYSYTELATIMGVSRSTTVRWNAGATIEGPEARLLRLLVRLKLTMSNSRFEEIVHNIRTGV